MEHRPTTLEKAFELARSGKCLNVLDIEKRLKSERFDTHQLHGPYLKKQLLQLIEAAKIHQPLNE